MHRWRHALALLALVATTVVAAPRAAGVTWFHSPTGNIQCGYMSGNEAPSGSSSVFCATANDGLGMLLMRNGFRGKDRFPAIRRGVPLGPALSYGRARNLGAFRCTSSTDGMRCYLRWNGRGFFISRDSWAWLG